MASVVTNYQGSPQAGIKSDQVGMVWAEFVTRFTSHIKVELTVKAEWVAMLKGAG